MKKLICHLALCALAIAVTLALVWALPGTCPHDLAAIVNKKAILMHKPSPRMIFIGGSSQLTLDTPLIERETGYHAVNMSLWGGMGTRGHLNEIAPHLRQGDAVVITIEYGAILDRAYARYIETNDEAKKFFFLASPYHHLLAYLKEGRPFDALAVIHELSQLKVKSYIRNIILLDFKNLFANGLPNFDSEFNRNGDRIPPYVTVRPLGDRNTSYGYPDWNDLAYLNDFHAFAKQRGVKVLFYFPPFPIEHYNLNKPYIDAFHRLLSDRSTIPLINTPEDFIYPDEYFADTIYHLNPKGERIRSDALLRFIKRAL